MTNSFGNNNLHHSQYFSSQTQNHPRENLDSSSSLYMWQIANDEVKRLNRLKKTINDQVTQKVDNLVHMTEHPVFSKYYVLCFMVLGDLVSRDPATGRAYVNIVKKCARKMENLQHVHIKNFLVDEVKWL